MPLISVIIPVYNVEKYLERCLESVLCQTLRDIEIICVNDGSADNSLEILNKYAGSDNRIKVISKENGGLSDARNKGLEFVSAPYTAFVDSDDWIDERTFEEAYKAIEKYKTDFVCFASQKVYENGKVEIQKLPFNGFQKMNYKKFRKTPVTVWSKIFKTSIIKDRACIFPKGYNYEDNVFWMMYYPWVKSGYYINKPFYNYFQRADSIIYSDKKLFRYINLIPIIFEYYKNHNLLDKYGDDLSGRFKDYLKMDFNEAMRGTK